MGKHQEAFYEMLAARSNPKAKRAPKGMGAFAEFEERMKREMAEAGEYPASDLRSNPVRQYVGTLYGRDDEQVTMVKARSAKAAKRAMGRMGSTVLDDFRKVPRGSREVAMDVSEGQYGFQAKHTRPAKSLKAAKSDAERQGWNVESSHYLRPGVYDLGEFDSEQFHTNPGQERLTPQEMATYKRHIQNFLDAGMSHNDVRKQLGNMSFPLYQAIRRSGGTKGAQPVHRGSSHLLRNPSTGMSVPEAGTEFTALSTYHDIAGMGQNDSHMYLRFVVNADGSATHVMGGSRGNTLPAAAVRRLFEDGHCGGLGNVTSLSKPEIA